MKRRTTLERFNEKFIVTPGCWPWTGGKDAKKYGMFWLDGKTLHAQRVSHELFIGPIPDGLMVLHRCDNPCCVNPDHLEVGSSKENSEDMVRKGRQAKGRGISTSRLTAEAVRSIRDDSRSHRSIAADYGVSKTTIGFIKRNIFWRHA